MSNRTVLRRGDVAVDIGANVGYYTRIASQLVGSDGAVLAFEPMPAAFRVLQLNCADLSNTRLFPVALSDSDSEVVFYVRKNGDTSSLLPDSLAMPIRSRQARPIAP